VLLNRAMAVAMVDRPGAALVLVDGLAASGDLDNYHLLHAARAELLRRIGSLAKAGGWRAWDVTPDYVCVPPI
jgi:RNA polymerase sigma-70 factor (ECF subfamily)